MKISSVVVNSLRRYIVIIFPLLFMGWCGKLSAQDVNTAEKFNERGISTSESSSIVGGEVIGDYDGNLSLLLYSSKVNIPNDMSTDITVMYNANVEHRTFTLPSINGPRHGRVVNAPLWIIGIKGFAVQTLNFESNFYAHKEGNSSYATNLTGEETPLLTPGYHYTNSLDHSQGGYEFMPPSDHIELLRADGTKTVLFNKESPSNIITGTYYESNFEGYGYAIVELLTGQAQNGLRKMWYKPGDGLTYYFEEEFVHYSGQFPSDTLFIDYPRVMYLKSFFSQAGDSVKLIYNEDTLRISNFKFGRKIFNKATTNSMWMSYFGRDYNQIIASVRYIPDMTPEGYKLGYFTLENFFKHDETYFIIKSTNTSSLLSPYRNSNPDFTKNLSISKVIDVLGRNTNIEYEVYRRIYTALPAAFSCSLSLYLPKKISYSTGKITELQFINDPNRTFSYEHMQGPCSGVVPVNLDNSLRQMYRDSYTNFMVEERKQYNKINSQTAATHILSEQYSYKWGNGNNSYSSQFCFAQVEDIITEIKKISQVNQNSSPNTITISKNFSKFNIPFKPYNQAGELPGSVIKLMSEKINDNTSGTVKEIRNEYHHGIPNSSYYSGTFFLKSVQESISNSGLSSSKMISYEYTDTPLYHGIGLHQDIRKYLKTSETIIDAGGLRKTTHFSAQFIPTQDDDYLNKNYFFKLGLPTKERDFTSEGTKSENMYQYYSSNDPDSAFLIGKLKSQISNSHSRSLKKDVLYYKANQDSSRLFTGLPKEEIFSNGVKLVYSYPRIGEDGWIVDGGLVFKRFVLRDSIQAKIVANDGTIVSQSFKPIYTQPQPFRTDKIYNNGEDTITTWRLYNPDGQLGYEIDAQGFYSSYKYDVAGRLLQVNLPGSFNPGMQVSTDTSYLNIYKTNNTASHFRDYYFQSQIDTNSQTFQNEPIVSFFSSGGNHDQIQVVNRGDGNDFSEIAETDEKIIDPTKSESEDESEPVEETEVEPELPIGSGDYITSNIYYVLFNNSINFTNVVEIDNGALSFITDSSQCSAGENNVITIKGRSSSGGTRGSIDFNFLPNSLITIDVKPILEEFKQNNDILSGFQFSTRLVDPTVPRSQKKFMFSKTQKPSLTYGMRLLNVENSYVKSSVVYNYNDQNNSVEIIKRLNYDPQSNDKIHTRLNYDSFGQLQETYVKTSNGNFELKKTENYNYLGLKTAEQDAEGRSVYYKYDYFSRPVASYFGANNENAPKVTFNYELPSSGDAVDIFEKKTVTDEVGQATIVKIDKKGLIKNETKYDQQSFLATNYHYDSFNRLIDVIPPKGTNYKTSYQYDDHSNIITKTSPDEGTLFYKYDKYGNLRFSVHAANMNHLYFNGYDDMNRLVFSGEHSFTVNFDFSGLNPDVRYSTAIYQNPQFEHPVSDTSKLVLVNMYDKYVKTGVFTPIPSYLFSNAENKYLKGRLAATAFRDNPGESWSYKIYAYDYSGRVSTYLVKMGNSDWKSVINEYNNLGGITKQTVNNQFRVWNDYDGEGRLHKVWSNIHNVKTEAKLDAVYSYDKNDKITLAVFNGNNSIRQKYIYDFRGRATSISGDRVNTADSTNTPVGYFNETLTYFANNNVKTILLSNKGNDYWDNLDFQYSYDGYNRLIASYCNSNDIHTEHFTYDENGNITGKYGGNGAPFIYNYLPNTNKLSSILINSTQTKSYGYDYRGNVINDGRQDIDNIMYDRRNLILGFRKNLGSQTPPLNGTYNYDDKGNRIFKKIDNGTKEYYLRDHTGKELAVYDMNTNRLKMLNLYGNGMIGKVNVRWDSSLVELDGSLEWLYTRNDERAYYIKDHLGSIRMTIDSDGEIVNAQDYYPFGAILRSYITGSSVSDKYKFTEKERDIETNYDYFGARFYDAEIGRWLGVDPLADKYPGWSPYNYTLNNPLRFIDPDGREVRIYTGKVDKEGNPEYLTYTSGMQYEGDNKFVADMINSLNSLVTMGGKINELVEDLITSQNIHGILETPYQSCNVSEYPGAADLGKSTDSWTFINPTVKKTENGKLDANQTTTLMHELSHAHDHDKARMKGEVTKPSSNKKDTEIRAVYRENIVRNKIGFERRDTYGGKPINWKNLKK